MKVTGTESISRVTNGEELGQSIGTIHVNNYLPKTPLTMELVTPLQQKERIVLLDAIRGLALCGILILNMPGFSGPYQWYFNFYLANESGRANLIAWYLQNFVFEGSFRALFSMLFGAGAILLISRLEKNMPGLRPAEIYYRRLIWLLIFGLINGWVILWVGDILYCYAICGLFLFPFRNSSIRLLLTISLFFIAVLMFKDWLSRRESIELRDKGIAALAIEARKDSLTEEQKADLSTWKNRLESSKIENQRKEAEKELTKVNQSYTGVWSHFRQLNHDIESVYLYDELFFDAMIFILLGMALFRMGVLTGEKPWWLYAAFVAVGYTGGLIYAWFVGHWWQQANFNFYNFMEISPVKVTLFQIRRIFFSLGHLGVLVLLWKSGVFGWLINALARVGQMAFTNYLMQSIICTLLFFGYGLGYYGKIQRYEQFYVVGAVWAFQILFSVMWLKFFRFGPLEWLWRSLTYWKLQPMRKSTPAAPDMLP